MLSRRDRDVLHGTSGWRRKGGEVGEKIVEGIYIHAGDGERIIRRSSEVFRCRSDLSLRLSLSSPLPFSFSFSFPSSFLLFFFFSTDYRLNVSISLYYYLYSQPEKEKNTTETTEPYEAERRPGLICSAQTLLSVFTHLKLSTSASSLLLSFFSPPILLLFSTLPPPLLPSTYYPSIRPYLLPIQSLAVPLSGPSAVVALFLIHPWSAMSGLADPPPSRTPVASDAPPGKTRQLPVLSSSVPHSARHSMGDPMDVTPASTPATGAGAPVHSSDGDRPGANKTLTSNGSGDHSNVNRNHTPPGQAIGAAAAAQQPKVVQTAFIHKLYKYVDRGIPSGEFGLIIASSSQYAGGLQHPTSHLVVEHERQFRHVSHLGIFKSAGVRLPSGCCVHGGRHH